MVRPTHAEVNLRHVVHNITNLKKVLDTTELCAVVKADGYGHGDAPVAAAALEAGASMLAVALPEEGVRLREAGVDSTILVLAEPPADTVDDLMNWDLTPTLYSQALLDALISTGASTSVHVKIDTGMHRVGVGPRAALELIEAVEKSSSVELGGVWTHFSVADEDPDYTRHQMKVFDNTLADLDDLPLVHMANSAGALLFPESRRDMCRIGLAIYGLHPSPETREVVDLRPAMKLVTHVTHVRRLTAGARPSYGRIKELEVDSTVATAPIGYADGFARGLSQYGCGLIGGKRYPLAGMVTMDQIVLNVDDTDIEIGDEVVLLGEQGPEEVTADEWAEMLGTINYEVVCSIGPRVPRRYVT